MLSVVTLVAALTLLAVPENPGAGWEVLAALVGPAVAIVLLRADNDLAERDVGWLAVLACALYLAMPAYLGAAAWWFVVAFGVVVLTAVCLSVRGVVRGALLALLAVLTWRGAWLAALSVWEQRALLLGLAMLAVLLVLLQRQHEHTAELHQREHERQQRAASLLTALADIDDATTVEGAADALDAIGLQELVVYRRATGSLTEYYRLRAAADGQHAELALWAERCVASGRELQGTVPSTEPWEPSAGQTRRAVFVVPIRLPRGVTGALCAVLIDGRPADAESAQWARTLAGSVAVIWEREERMRSQEIESHAIARLQRTRQAFVNSVSQELRPGAVAVRESAERVQSQTAGTRCPPALSALRRDVRGLRGAVDAMLLMADIARSDGDGLPSEAVAVAAVIDLLGLQGVEVSSAPEVQRVRVLAHPGLLARAVALWLCAPGVSGTRTLTARTERGNLLLQRSAAPSGAVAEDTPVTAPERAEQLLRAAGAAQVTAQHVLVPLLPRTEDDT